ncbi:hypothetical protein K437DRAFT_267452 [Tilletiaria anomala UBC 951]|uniref:RecQ-mediated genome instability protein 1 n=1 Tax=Tilletiaria anomala (strain ATCC 24038 / CBS 436.72 / UBC 951) TaxID=1037660 RepID=A0A066W9F9_TILAU|nr:uncharacterized protein K437DRAFT_267452 [Tilletiaria anomala UBC 951]KDN49193.1 hypothetical protein K437DRAFT_267452 [Tilletiaria anomala UBC 951]
MVDERQLLSVRRWIESQYPTLALDQAWLEQAADYVAESAPEPLSTPNLIKAVHFQLLHADLRQFIKRTTSTDGRGGGFAAVLQAAEVKDGTNAKYRRIDEVISGRLASAGSLAQISGKVRSKRTELLVQVVGITDVGIPVQGLLDVTLARQQASKTEAGRKLLENAAEVTVLDNSSRGRSCSASQKVGRAQARVTIRSNAGADSEDASLAAEEEVLRSSIIYPRSMLQLELDDGYVDDLDSRPVTALEMARIPELALGKTALGCKLAIRDAEVCDGIILLSPDNVTVKGGSVMELQDAAEERLIKRLKVHLDMAQSGTHRGRVGGSSGGRQGPPARLPIKSISPVKRAAPTERKRDSEWSGAPSHTTTKDNIIDIADYDEGKLTREALWAEEPSKSPKQGTAPDTHASRTRSIGRLAGTHIDASEVANQPQRGKGKLPAIDIIAIDDDDNDEFAHLDFPWPTQTPKQRWRGEGQRHDDPIVLD